MVYGVFDFGHPGTLEFLKGLSSCLTVLCKDLYFLQTSLSVPTCFGLIARQIIVVGGFCDIYDNAIID